MFASIRVRGPVVALLIAGAATQAGPARAQITLPYAQAGAFPVAPGVVERWGSTASNERTALVKMAQIDPTQQGIHFRTSLPHDQVTTHETTSSQALRYDGEGHHVVAALNGPISASYPATHYTARGLNVHAGELTGVNKRPDGNLTAFAVDGDGQPRIGTPKLNVTMTLPGGAQASVDRVNGGRLPGETVLYTPRFDTHTWTESGGDEYVIEGAALPLRVSGTWTGRVTEIRRGQSDSHIGPGQLVLSSSGAAAAFYAGLSVDDTVRIDIGIDPGWQNVVEAIGAKTLIVRNGRIDIQPANPYDLDYAHPRSLVGITATGRVLMVAVEGRSESSAGLHLADAASLMIELGAVDAVNMDGGGSTTLLIRQPGDRTPSVVNQLSGGGTTLPGEERAVSNSLQVISEFPTGPLATLIVTPSQSSLYVGQSQQYTAKGHDRYFNGVLPKSVNWSVSGGGVIGSNGLFSAQSAGTFDVVARAGEISASTRVVLAKPPPPSVPVGLTAAASANRFIDLSWAASTSKLPGIAYRVYRDGLAIGVRQTGLTYRDQPSAGAHTYRVRAIDSIGTRSALSLPVVVQAYISVPPPGVPTGVTATASSKFVTVAWSPPTGGTQTNLLYRVWRDGVAIGTRTRNTTYVDTPLAGRHKYQVRAIDANGLRSALSWPVWVTTAP